MHSAFLIDDLGALERLVVVVQISNVETSVSCSLVEVKVPRFWLVFESCSIISITNTFLWRAAGLVLFVKQGGAPLLEEARIIDTEVLSTLEVILWTTNAKGRCHQVLLGS